MFTGDIFIGTESREQAEGNLKTCAGKRRKECVNKRETSEIVRLQGIEVEMVHDFKVRCFGDVLKRPDLDMRFRHV